MLKPRKKIIILVGVLASFLLFGRILLAQSQEECGQMVVNVIARNAAGDYIANTKFEIYEQALDVDGKPKPVNRVGSGKIDYVLGFGSIKFTPKADDYVIKFTAPGTSKTPFYFFNAFNGLCGGEVETTEVLSSLHVVLRNTDGELLKNRPFSVYTQRFDVDGEPIKEKQDLVAKANTSAEGEVRLYLPSASRTLNGEGGRYVFVAQGPQGSEYDQYDIEMPDSSEYELEYVFSDLEITLKDAEGNLFPAKTKIEMFNQDYDDNQEHILGQHIRDVYTDDNGQAVFEHPAGTYVARVKGEGGKYYYFWDLEIIDQERQSVVLTPTGTWQPEDGACQAETHLKVVARNLSGSYIPGIKFELFSQKNDVDGQPVPDKKAVGGTIADNGEANLTFHPNPLKKYILKMYDKNSNAGEFWFYDNLSFVCGQDKEIVKYLPALNIILRRGDGHLLKNHKFSIYTQRTDIDGAPIKEKKDLVATLATSDKGQATIYLAPKHPYNQEKSGVYVFSTVGTEKGQFVVYGLKMKPDQDLLFEYMLSNIVFSAKDARGRPLAKANLYFYGQNIDEQGNYILGKKLRTLKLDEKGVGSLEYPHGYYAAVVKDGAGQNNIFWHIHIKDQKRLEKELVVNLSRLAALDAKGNRLKEKISFALYRLSLDKNNEYKRDRKIKSLKPADNGWAEISLAPGPYLAVVNKNKIDYGRAFWAQNDQEQNIAISLTAKNKISRGQRYKLKQPAKALPLPRRLAGRILLQVEANGEAWYVNPTDLKRYYLKDGQTAYQLLRRFGLGISNQNLAKIPIGLNEKFEEFDYDGDLVPDKMEQALGTDMYLRDSDSDGYDDGTEIKHNYNPLGAGKLPIDMNLTRRLAGRILLQVESRGEAWYVNPADQRRYYLKDGQSAFQIMRWLSLGITNQNLEEIEVGQ